MRKPDEVESSSKGKQNDVAPEAVKTEGRAVGMGKTPLSDPICKPISLIFNPAITPQQTNPTQTIVVTGFLAIAGVSSGTCPPITVTSLNPKVLLPQPTAVIPKGMTTVPISAFYTPSSTAAVVYVYASNSYGATVPVGVVVNSQASIHNLHNSSQHTVTNLTYPPITATGAVKGQVTINPAAGANGVEVNVSSTDPSLFNPESPVRVKPGETSADVPTTVIVQSSPYTVYSAANCDETPPYGPVPVVVPSPTR